MFSFKTSHRRSAGMRSAYCNKSLLPYKNASLCSLILTYMYFLLRYLRQVTFFGHISHGWSSFTEHVSFEIHKRDMLFALVLVSSIWLKLLPLPYSIQFRVSVLIYLPLTSSSVAAPRIQDSSSFPTAEFRVFSRRAPSISNRLPVIVKETST